VPVRDSDTVSHARFWPSDMEQMLFREPRTVLERQLDGFTAAIREKLRWWVKMFNAEVVKNFRAEVARPDVDDGIFQFVLQLNPNPTVKLPTVPPAPLFIAASCSSMFTCAPLCTVSQCSQQSYECVRHCYHDMVRHHSSSCRTSHMQQE